MLELNIKQSELAIQQTDRDIQLKKLDVELKKLDIQSQQLQARSASSAQSSSQSARPSGPIKVSQYTLDGNVIKTFNSIKEAAKAVKCDRNSLGKAIAENRQYKDFEWKLVQ